MMLGEMISFIENGGRLRAGDEPKYGEPFYGEYMQQYINRNYKPGDRVRITTDNDTFEGIILVIDTEYRLELLLSGRTVHKDKRNKRDILYRQIQAIELLQKDDGSFDLATVDPLEWEWRQNRGSIFSDEEELEMDRKRRLVIQKEFQQVYPVDFAKSHVIYIEDGCSLYFPFDHDKISAEIFMVRDEDKVTRIPCKTGTPYPNKNSYHAYNSKSEGGHPNLLLYLPDNGFRYEDVNIVCVWTIEARISGEKENTTIKIVNIHHIEEIQQIKEGRNLIFAEMRSWPLLEYGKELFTKTPHPLEDLMDYDMYFVNDPEDLTTVVIKNPEGQTEGDVNKYICMSTFALNDFFPVDDLPDEIELLGNTSFPVEVFCNIDKKPDRYFSDHDRKCRETFSFTMLPD